MVGYLAAKDLGEVAQLNSLRAEAVKELSQFLPPFTPTVGDDSRLRFLAAITSLRKSTPLEWSEVKMHRFVRWAAELAQENVFPYVLLAVPEFLQEERALAKAQAVSR